MTFVPKKFASQYHVKYADAAKMEQMLKDAKYNAWTEFVYGQKSCSGTAAAWGPIRWPGAHPGGLDG